MSIDLKNYWEGYDSHHRPFGLTVGDDYIYASSSRYLLKFYRPDPVLANRLYIGSLENNILYADGYIYNIRRQSSLQGSIIDKRSSVDFSLICSYQLLSSPNWETSRGFATDGEYLYVTVGYTQGSIRAKVYKLDLSDLSVVDTFTRSSGFNTMKRNPWYQNGSLYATLEDQRYSGYRPQYLYRINTETMTYVSQVSNDTGSPNSGIGDVTGDGTYIYAQMGRQIIKYNEDLVEISRTPHLERVNWGIAVSENYLYVGLGHYYGGGVLKIHKNTMLLVDEWRVKNDDTIRETAGGYPLIIGSDLYSGYSGNRGYLARLNPSSMSESYRYEEKFYQGDIYSITYDDNYYYIGFNSKQIAKVSKSLMWEEDPWVEDDGEMFDNHITHLVSDDENLYTIVSSSSYYRTRCLKINKTWMTAGFLPWEMGNDYDWSFHLGGLVYNDSYVYIVGHKYDFDLSDTIPIVYKINITDMTLVDAWEGDIGSFIEGYSGCCYGGGHLYFIVIDSDNKYKVFKLSMSNLSFIGSWDIPSADDYIVGIDYEYNFLWAFCDIYVDGSWYYIIYKINTLTMQTIWTSDLISSNNIGTYDGFKVSQIGILSAGIGYLDGSYSSLVTLLNLDGTLVDNYVATDNPYCIEIDNNDVLVGLRSWNNDSGHLLILSAYSTIFGISGLFVRDREIQIVFNGKHYRSPDFGDNWYESTGIDIDAASCGFDVNNYQNSFVGGYNKLYVFNSQSGNVYNYTSGDIISGRALDTYCDLNSNITIIGTNAALYKTLKYGDGGTRVFLNEPVTAVAIGGSYVSNPFFSFAPEELNDAHLYSTDSSYSTARLASNGQLLHDDYAKIGQSKVDSTYSVDRFGLVFDTSLLPDNPIISAMIRLYVIELRADIEFSVYVQGSNDYPSVPIIVGDYNYSLYTGNCGYVNSDSIQEGRYLTINLNSSGLNLINKEGYSRFIIRTNRDINGNEPTGREFIRVNQREKGGHQTPKLFVTIRKEN